jgi:hypothetical protein
MLQTLCPQAMIECGIKRYTFFSSRWRTMLVRERLGGARSATGHEVWQRYIKPRLDDGTFPRWQTSCSKMPSTTMALSPSWEPPSKLLPVSTASWPLVFRRSQIPRMGRGGRSIILPFCSRCRPPAAVAKSPEEVGLLASHAPPFAGVRFANSWPGARL